MTDASVCMNDSGTSGPTRTKSVPPRSLTVPEIQRALRVKRMTAPEAVRPFISNLIVQIGHWECADSRDYIRPYIKANIRRIEAAQKGE